MLPNFLVIGATRSGTTSLHHYLRQHPDVYVPEVKEPNFFISGVELPSGDDPVSRHVRFSSSQWVSSLTEYERLFDGVDGESAVGEVSPLYMRAASTPERIREVLSDPRLIAILRHPVDHMYASLMGLRREGREPRTDLRVVVREEIEAGIRENVALGSFVASSRYHHWLKGYYERFPHDRIRVWLYDDLRADEARLLREMFGFLGVDDAFGPDTAVRHNATGIIRNPVKRILWTRSHGLRFRLRPYLPGALRHWAAPLFTGNLQRPPLDPEVRKELTELFRDEIARLEDLIDRDLGHWLT